MTTDRLPLILDEFQPCDPDTQQRRRRAQELSLSILAKSKERDRLLVALYRKAFPKKSKQKRKTL
jgi:hypothetical protein